MIKILNFKKIKIKLASSNKILKWSFGEVKYPEFINQKTLKLTLQGLFCPKIFSNCYSYCSKKNCICYKKITNLKKVHYSYKMGHLVLNYPVIHILYLKSIPNSLLKILNLSSKTIEKIISFKFKIVIKSYLKNVKKYDIIKYNKNTNFNIFTLSGAKSIKKLLSDNELLLDCKILNKKINKCNSYLKLYNYLEKINKIYVFYLSGNKPSWIILNILPIIPPKMRPLIFLNFGKFASSDINELYKKIINRNLRLRSFLLLKIHKQIINNEKVLLQDSVNSLFDNEKTKNPILSNSKRTLKSFSSLIKGKYGRFRQNLLGKRVDFSGRTVISIGPYLKIYQCELPIIIGLELFKPFIYYELKKKKILSSISLIEEYYKKNKKQVVFLLNKIIKYETLILNRAPTLHRMGVQSFKIILTKDKTIKLHPLLCLSYNADFDGDQMAIHIPLTINSKNESKYLLFSIQNLISPSNNELIIIPTQDIVMGIYYLTYNFNYLNKKIFIKINNVLHYYNIGKINIHDNIIVKINFVFYKTTVGRIIFFYIFNYNNYDYFNKLFNKKKITYLIKYFLEFSYKKIIFILDKIKNIGFYFSTLFGISISYNDLKEIKLKKTIFKMIKKTKNYNLFLIIELLNNLFFNFIIKNINLNKYYYKKKFLNNLFIMLDSGSRGSILQIRQLISFRGFFSKSNGDIIINPIINNLKFGLNMKEYFISTYGARKGLTDTSLKTANSGYLTRKLIDVMQDIVIYKLDCETKIGIKINLKKYSNINILYKKIYGRILLKNIYLNFFLIIKKNTLINNKIIYLIIKLNINTIYIRSVVFCISQKGICICCYGIDLSKNNLINIGVPIGIISAQSIGEPGTQLTMRTFHTGGVANFINYKNFLLLNYSGFIFINKCKCILNKYREIIILSIFCNFYIVKNFFIIEFYKLRYGDFVCYRNGYFIKNNIKLLKEKEEFCIFSENFGKIKYLNINKDIYYCNINKKYYFKINELSYLFIIGKNIKKYFIPKNFILIVNNNNYIFPGEIIAKIFNIKSIKSNIIGGLPRLSELFESRIPKKKSLIAEIDGIINIKYNLNFFIINIISNFGNNKIYKLNFLRKIYVNNGDYVKIGDIISDGKLDLNDIIKFIGIDYLIFFFLKEINDIYLPQGIYINDKHLELVLKQMIQKVRILYSGDCLFTIYDILYLEDVLIENIVTLKNSNKICLYERIVIGITKSSLESDSFFSAASFQETNKVLIDSAIRNRSDYLLGLKENVVVGKIIPAGTGLLNYYYNLNKKSKSIDDFIKRKNFRVYIYFNEIYKNDY